MKCILAMAQDRDTNQWWLVYLRGGEPYRAYHPEHGLKVVHRDTFNRWSKPPPGCVFLFPEDVEATTAGDQ